MMGLDFFRRSVELARQYLKPGQRAVYTIQTNGTLLDEEWAAFFRENDFLVGISIDGPRELHDAYRVNKGGKGSFDQVMRGLEHPARRRGRVERADDRARRRTATTAARCTASCATSAGRASSSSSRSSSASAEADEDGTVPWTSWRDRPLYVQEGSRVTGRSVTGEQYGRFLIDVFEEWVRRDVGEVYVQMFDVALANWVGEPPGLCVHSETCGLALALEHTGDLYSCDHFVEPQVQARQHQRDAHARARRLAAAAPVRPGQARHTAAVLPRLRRSLRLPRRLPQGPVHRDAGRRAGTQFPLPRLQGLLPPRRPADADHGHASRPGPRARPRSSSSTRPRTPGAAATIRAPAAPAANGRTATAAAPA